MKMFLTSLIIALGTAQVSYGADIISLDLFTVSSGSQTVQYKAQVDPTDCSFNAKKPTAVYMVKGSTEKLANFLEARYVAFDYLQKAAQAIVAEVKFLESKDIHWPVTLTVQKDEQGQCQGTAIGTNSGVVIKSVSITDTGDKNSPMELMISGLTMDGQPVQTPITVN